MAGVRPYTVELLGSDGPSFYLSQDNNPPSSAGDGYFNKGDIIINTAPAAGGTAMWMCTTAGPGNTAVFKAVALAA